jgi:3D (Asp-Asp-Asp) domain-containing protein
MVRSRVFASVAVAAAVAVPADALAAGASFPVSGGGAIAPPPVAVPSAPPPSANSHGVWMGRVTITEYWPAPEAWFVGRLVTAPGLPGKHRIDWLYSARGLSMQGSGIGLDGRPYHIDALGSGGWVTASGRSTDAAKGWNGGAPYWRAGGYWRNSAGAVTFPLQSGGWSAGVGRRYVSLRGVTFAPGLPRPLKPYGSIAVDPQVIPLGSRVYIPAYRNDGHGGWFIAQDTGGAIVGHKIDVYRTPPASPSNGGQYLVGQRVFVVKPGS